MAVLEDTVVDHVLAQAKVETVPSNYQDVVSGKAVPSAAPDEQTEAGDGSGEVE